VLSFRPLTLKSLVQGGLNPDDHQSRVSTHSMTTPQFQMHKMLELHLLLVALAFLGKMEAQVITGTEISTINCEGEDCATLYLITSSGEEVAHKGTNSKIKQKDVEGARVVGLGCFMIYKGKGFSGPSIKIEGASPLSLKDQGHTWTTVKSVLYSSNCNFSRQAGAEVYVIVAVLAVVFLVAIVALAWSRFRRRTHTQVPAQDAA